MRTGWMAGIGLAVAACGTLAAGGEPTISWQAGTRRLIARHGNYGRFRGLADGAVLACFSRGATAWVARSEDGGTTFGPAVEAAGFAHGVATNAELLPLANGEVLLLINERPADGRSRFAVRVHVSADGGRAWAARSLAYEADSVFENGCWEPAAVQLPDGEILLFFANEDPYRHSHEQEISVVRSRDDGCTWSAPRQVSFRPGHRDGMPVPLLLPDGGLVLAIEDNEPGRKLQPSMLKWDVAAACGREPIGPDSPRRWRPLGRQLPGHVYAGAPYICLLSNGVSVLVCQSDEGGRPERPAVCLGDRDFRRFGRPTYPLPPDEGRKGQWNALFPRDDDTVTLISSSVVDGVPGLWAIDGRVTAD